MTNTRVSGLLETETVLADDHPVLMGHVYIADGRTVRSSISGTVAQLRQIIGADEVRRCDIFHEKRQFMKVGERV
jgi:hypothetical protein